MASRWIKGLLAVAVACLFASAMAPAAGAAPAWKFNGSSAWAGSEEVVNHSLESSLGVPGMTITCEPFVYVMQIENVLGTGRGSIVSVPLSNCFTNTVCTVEAIEATSLPWTTKLTTVSTNPYLIIAGVEFTMFFGNPMCALYETEVVIHSTAGGRVDNPNESTVFDAASFSTTGTKLLVFGSTATWSGTFRMIATGAHVGETLSAG